MKRELRLAGAVMSSSSLSSRGQTTIPKSVREAAGLSAGDALHFTVLADGTIVVRRKNRSVRDIAIKPPKRRHVRVDQMSR
jgi:AbrB family looped-hinge helix DNA binding protein